MKIRHAEPGDRAEALRLLRSFDLPTAGVPEAMSGFLIAEGTDGDVAGLVGLEVHGRHGLLRSLAVDPRYRGRGLGGALVAEVVETARRARLEGLYLLTTTADDYFLRHGFRVVDRDTAPEAVRRSVEFSEACPASAVAMSLPL